MSALINVVRSFEYNSYDIAMAFHRVVTRKFGENPYRGVRSNWKRLWRRYPFTRFDLKTGVDQTESIVLGQFQIRGFDGFFNVDGKSQSLQALISVDNSLRVDELFSEVETQLKTASIYKGKALILSGSSEGVSIEFMDLSKVSPEGFVYNEKVSLDLRAHIWNLIAKPEICLRQNIRIQRKVLFKGPFGSGKTIAAMLTAKLAVDNGFTVIYIDPTHTAQMVSFGMEFAAKYQRSVIIFEDIDKGQREYEDPGYSKFLSSIDGFLSKNTEVIVVMTTNYPEKIMAALKRPGRIDKIIDFGVFGGKDITDLIHITIPENTLDPDINWERVINACRDYMPVFVHNVGISAQLMSIDRGSDSLVTEEMLIQAAEDLREQHKACTVETEMGFHGKK